MVAILEGAYLEDPTHEFFGLGNNKVGPDPLSAHGLQTVQGLFTLALRPLPRLILAGTFGHSDAYVRRGKLVGDTPATMDAFPNLAGLGRTRTNPVSFSIVYNNRVDVTRPTRGWSLTAKIQHVSPELGGDHRFTRYILDASYLLPLVTGRQAASVWSSLTRSAGRDPFSSCPRSVGRKTSAASSRIASSGGAA